MKIIAVNLGERAYQIHIEESLEGVASENPGMIITNDTIHRLYGPLFRKLFRKTPVLAMTDGESYKTLDVASRLFGEMIKHRAGRHATVIGIGGGVVGDMAGFIAATYMRGVPFMQIPTTLLAMVDSSVGGKVGVNHALAKNMIGAFYQPKSVSIDIRFLKTLPEREMVCGLAEIVKYGLILDESFFYWIEEEWESVLHKQTEAVHKAVARSCEIKAAIVEKDEHDHGERMLLNFGHTWGHALENLGRYSILKHGEAVFLGMLAANHLSYVIGRLHAKQFERVDQFLKLFIPGVLRQRGVKKLLTAMTWSQFMNIVRSDKKAAEGHIQWIVLDHIGQASVTADIPLSMIRKSFKYLKQQVANV